MPVVNPKFELSAEYMQLALGLELPEVELDGVSREEAQRRSELARDAFEEAGASEAYRELRDEGWPWRQAAYIAWAATPKPRKPDTQEKLAREVLGLTSDRAINMWRKKNPMIDERVAILLQHDFFDWRSTHIRALNEGASQAGADYKFFNHLKLALEIHGIYVPASKITAEMLKSVSMQSLDDLSDGELEALAGELAKRIGQTEGE